MADAGTFSPYEHGEVYVLDDGGEVDLDLGNYERFLNVSLGRDNNITTGKAVRKLATFFWGTRYDLLFSKTDKNNKRS